MNEERGTRQWHSSPGAQPLASPFLVPRSSFLEHPPDTASKFLHQLARIEAGLETLERELGPGEVAEHDVGPAQPHIDSDHEAVARSDVEHRRPAPARRIDGGAFVNGALGDEVAHECRYHTAPDLHSTRELGARDRPMLAHEVERDTPIDVARRRSRGSLEAEGVDLPH